MIAVFEELYAGLAEHAAPVIRCMIQRGHAVTIACHAREKDGYEKLIAAGFYQGTPGLTTFEQLDWNAGVDLLFSVVPGSPGPLLRDTAGPTDCLRVAMPHGLTDKPNKFPAGFIGHPLGYFNALCASGSAMFSGSWESYTAKHPQTVAALRIIEAGVPKTDALFAGNFQREEVLDALGLDPGKKTVLYAPTFQREASLECFGEQIIRQLVQLDANILVRLHHLSLDMKNPDALCAHGGHDWRGTLSAWEKHGNLRSVEGDSTPYFVAADLLVGDVSGACYEYILQDKPVVFIDVPDYFKKFGRDTIAWQGRAAGTVVKEIADLTNVVAQQLDKPAIQSARRRRLIEQLTYRRGDSADYIVKTLENLVQTRDFPVWAVRQNLRMDRLLDEYIIALLCRCAATRGRIMLFGAGKHTVRLLELCRRAQARGADTPVFTAVVVDNAESDEFEGIPLTSLDRINAPPDCIILSTDYFQDQMRAKAHARWGNTVEIINLYERFPWHRPESNA